MCLFELELIGHCVFTFISYFFSTILYISENIDKEMNYLTFLMVVRWKIKIKRRRKEVLTGVSAIGTLRASMVPHRYPCSRSHPCMRTLTLHASSFCRLETFWVPEKAWNKIYALRRDWNFSTNAMTVSHLI